jgi:hypothetical protein
VLARQKDAAEQVEAKVNALVGQIERVLLTVHAWSRDGLVNIDDPVAFNRLLQPVLQQRGIVRSIAVATDAGRELMLLKSADGWHNRLTDVAHQGTKQHWLYWKDAHLQTGDRWQDHEYDPRKSAWFIGALAVPEGQIYWSNPYTVLTTNDAGISVSVRWNDKNNGQQVVIAFEVLLTDISRFTTQLDFGKKGHVALLTRDGRVLGLPKDPQFTTDDAVKKSALQEPGALGLPQLDAAWQQSREMGGENLRTFTVQAGKSGTAGTWLVSWHSLPVRNQEFRIVSLAPEDDFATISRYLSWVLLLLILTSTAVAMLATQRLVGSVRRSIFSLFLGLETSRRQIAAQMRLRMVVGEISRRLQAARQLTELAQILLSDLARRLDLGQALFCIWDESSQGLHVVARYGGMGADCRDAFTHTVSQDSSRGNLLEQCANNRQSIVIEQPGRDYFHIQSGLGHAEMTTILILPVVHAGRLFAVLELAGLHAFTDEDRQLLTELEPIVAMSLDILLRSQPMLDRSVPARGVDAPAPVGAQEAVMPVSQGDRGCETSHAD